MTIEKGRGEEYGVVAALAAMVSLVALVWFFRHGDVLLYGDAVAHLNIARRIVDSRNAGWDQIGSVWLPLPHLLAAPLVANDYLWRSGLGGSLPSMLAYVLGVVAMYRLVRGRASALAASVAAAIFGLNPSLVYMQATAMTESIFLAAMLWALVYFDEYLRALSPAPAGAEPTLEAWRALERCGVALAAAIFTRYDGWLLAFVMGVWAVLAGLLWLTRFPEPAAKRRLLHSLVAFLLLLALCPTLWLAHNYKINKRPLDWLNGPYSAKAIEQRTTRPSDAPYPGKNHMRVAGEYFLKAARMNTGEGRRESWLMIAAVSGSLVALGRLRRFSAFALLWFPLPFYAYSVAYGSVPIFVPEWWPFSYYNVRYGLELLPAFAALAALLVWAVEAAVAHSRVAVGALAKRLLRPAPTLAAAILLLVVALAYQSSVDCWSPRSQGRDYGRTTMIPLCYREAIVNSRDRQQMEAQLAQTLAPIAANATVMMHISEHPGALQMAGISFRRVVNESTFMVWDAGLSAPFAVADYVVAIAGDPVAEAVARNPRGLVKLAILHTLGKPDVTVYRSLRR